MQQKEDVIGQVYARTIDDAAKCIGISRAGFYRLIGSRQIRTIKVGCRTLVAECELRRFIDERMAAAA